jgi:integrase
MALKLYRRHRKECEGGHPEDSRSGEFEEGRRGWKKCGCLIHASGTLGGKFNRKQTGKSNWDEAKTLAAVWEQTQSWDGKIQVKDPPVPSTMATPEVTIADAMESFIASRSNRGIEASTLAKYRTLSKQLRAWSDGRGYVKLQQLTVADMDFFYASWKDGKRSRAKKLERLKAFVKFCGKRKWLSENLVEDLEAPEGSSIPANKAPFTDAELNRIYAACDSFGGPTSPGPGYRNWSGEDMKDFIMLSVCTGLRISDVATFDISRRLNGNDVFLRMHKTKKELYTWIPDWLVKRLRVREQTYGTMIFRTGRSVVARTMAELWRTKLARVFQAAGKFDEQPHPHRFRHTFTRILLEKGVPIADVAELIGDTEEMVRKHYAKWVPERQARLTKILTEAFADKPTLKLVAMSKRG